MLTTDMQTAGKYIFDKAVILEKSYELICLFFANKEIARRTLPRDAGAPLVLLEKQFFETKATRLLIEIAASVRVMDDQIKGLDGNDPVKIQHNKLIAEINKYEFALFDDLDLTLRETCNKIIHSDIFELHTQEGHEAHETDIAFQEGMGERSVKWIHTTNYVRLGGKKGKKPWYVLLDIEVFVSAIVSLIA